MLKVASPQALAQNSHVLAQTLSCVQIAQTGAVAQQDLAGA